MANYQLIRYQADNIPTFDGNPKQVNRFITACNNFLDAHRDNTNQAAPINVALFDTIMNKLVGRAADIIASRIELNTWELVRTAIQNTFADQRSVDCIIQDIITMKPDRNEKSFEFGVRLQDARSLLFSKVNSSGETREIKLLKITEYGNLSMKTFINGLNYHMQLIVRLKNPQSLEEAISFAQEEENFLSYQHRQNTTSKINAFPTTHNNRPRQNFGNNTPMFRPQYNFNSSNARLSNYSDHQRGFNNSQYPGTSTQSMGFGHFRPNYPPRPQSFQTNPNFTNRFGLPNRTPSNQFRARPAYQNQQQIEPMDTSSGNTFRSRSIRQQSRAPQQKFVAEELFNQSAEPIDRNILLENSSDPQLNSNHPRTKPDMYDIQQYPNDDSDITPIPLIDDSNFQMTPQYDQIT